MGRLAPDLKQTRRDPAQGPPDSAMRLRPRQERKTLGAWGMQERWAMKLFTGWVMSAGLVLTAAAANAQPLAPYEIGEAPYAVASDIDGPYAEMPPEALAP